jgi:hypothetical protein
MSRKIKDLTEGSYVVERPILAAAAFPGGHLAHPILLSMPAHERLPLFSLQVAESKLKKNHSPAPGGLAGSLVTPPFNFLSLIPNHLHPDPPKSRTSVCYQ